MMSSNRSQALRATRSSPAGFSLVEVMAVVLISGFVIAGMLSFFMQFYSISFVNEQRNRINRDIRQLTGELSEAGRQANYFTLYNSYVTADRDTVGDRKLDGSAGDMLVFVSTDVSTGDISGLTGYFRDPTSADATSLGPVRRFEVAVPAGTVGTLESLIPTEATLLASDTVVELSRGLSNGKLFYNFWGKSIMVNGQIYHGNDAKRVTETYNFTISPRG